MDIEGEFSQGGIWSFFHSTFVPSMCKKEGHWSVKIVDYFWIDCACCLFWRGFVLGFILSTLLIFFIKELLNGLF